MKKILFSHNKLNLQIFLFLLFSVNSLILSHSAFGATLNLNATWTANEEADMYEYRLYRTDGVRTLIGTTLHPGTSYGPFPVTVPDGSSGTLIFVLTAVDTSGLESIDSSPSSYTYNLSTTTVTISATDNTATEAGSTTGTFTVSRTGSTSSSLTVNYVVSGTATSGSDYNALAGSVSIPAGSSTANITVTPINDAVVEGNETVIATLSANAAYTVGSPSSATVTITSDDGALPTVTISATDNTATEAGSTTGTFTVSRTGSTSSSLTVNYGVSGTATSGSDYNALAGSVSIPAGSSTANITVTPINDAVVEGNETVIATLSANAAYTVGSPSSATVTITSDDSGLPEEISTPDTPKGISNGYTGTSYNLSSGGSKSSLGSGHPVEYQFDWGNGSRSSWGSNSQPVIWTNLGTYRVRARARSKNNPNYVSSWSNTHSVSIKEKPFIHIASPVKGETWVVGTQHTITWSRNYLDGEGDLYLFYWYGGKWHLITTLSPTATSHPWTIPDIHDPLTSPPKPKGDIQSIRIWIGNWVDGRWECWDTNDPNFRILDDGWLFTISKGDKGGATLWFDDLSFDGYGVSYNFETFSIQGNYEVDAQGLMSGIFTINNLEGVVGPVSGNLTGKVNGNATEITLVLKDSNESLVFKMKGTRLLSEPDIVGSWSATISGDVTGSIDSLTIASFQDGDGPISHVFEISGSGGSSSIQGKFFFTPTSKVYGVYKVTGQVTDTGVISGTINPKKGKFIFNLTSDNSENKYKLVGEK